ncbi:GGDEF domain-containing protein [Butyrivibrio sp. AE3009]|uniref:GGDEF domain-containing protein n=1 Tax=Butyrivibrio sp. AE3009 TaxID=1280666 RepID=UPI0003B4209E|nr:GGDEF domain-containing protein [Butyrivibrio sp. AE3009]
MNLIHGAKTLIELRKDYCSMNPEEKKDFYEAKCRYYQNYVAVITIASALLSMLYLIPDYLINGSIIPTLLPRLFAFIAAAVFLIVTGRCKKRSVLVFMDQFLVHAIALSAICTVFRLEDNTYAGEGFIVIYLVFMLTGFASKPLESLFSCILFILEVIISTTVITYSDLECIIVPMCLCTIGIFISHMLLTLFYLDHYRIMQRLELAMVTDPLTQVYNRHLLERIITQNTLKDINGPVAVAMLDIDYFKQVNDEHGHYTGDLTLLYIGQKLSNETHDDDFVIRFGGEEFIIILKNCDVNNACARMEQFRRDIEAATDIPVPVTVSIGVSRYTGDFSKTIQNVDNALYKAKNTGRNKVVVY